MVEVDVAYRLNAFAEVEELVQVCVAASACAYFFRDKTAWKSWDEQDTRRAAATKAGGQGIRYPCRVRGREVYLFEDEGRWFVEARDVPAEI